MAAALHACLAVSLYSSGRLALLPELIDRDGIIRACNDCYPYQQEAAHLAKKLASEGFRSWVFTPARFHVKLNSILFALCGPFFGFSTLSLEPLYLLYYLLVVIFVYKLAENLFDARAALFASATVALWPSFLIHSLQPLKDSLFVAAMLALLLVLSNWLTKTYAWRGGLAMGLAGGFLVIVLALVRLEFKVMVLFAVSSAIVLMLARQLRARRILPGNLLSAFIVLLLLSPSAYLGLVSFGGIKSIARAPSPDGAGTRMPPPGEAEAHANKDSSDEAEKGLWASLRSEADWAASRMGALRENFAAGYPGSGSTIDREVTFKNAGDVLDYLPRAFVIGFFAPFPEMWLAGSSHVGRAGKIISAAETFVMYAIQILAIVGLFLSRRSLASWLLFMVATAGVVTLGLVVANGGALYRQRYIFWFLFIILGARGLVYMLSLTARKSRAVINPQAAR